MPGKVHLLKLSVGSASIEQMIDWQRRRSSQRRDGHYYHLTRMRPKREAEILDGGSLYWVIQGVILARQEITALEEMTGEDGIQRCAIFLAPKVIRVAPTPKRPFQGWRYLDPKDAPPDLATSRPGESDLPPRLMAALAEIGVC